MDSVAKPWGTAALVLAKGTGGRRHARPEVGRPEITWDSDLGGPEQVSVSLGGPGCLCGPNPVFHWKLKEKTIVESSQDMVGAKGPTLQGTLGYVASKPILGYMRPFLKNRSQNALLSS